jgi:hypothetical protein
VSGESNYKRVLADMRRPSETQLMAEMVEVQRETIDFQKQTIASMEARIAALTEMNTMKDEALAKWDAFAERIIERNKVGNDAA